ncbi:uncharacterized protein LOC131688602 [Topomyia yanbarensis]|uniref:uncharacterized protein LOC131688602 n=1 Tax=Topomyia yanbarensis TaxID=2498891 RepID=UPI00273AAF49|nr:uncharacterized protein LOC131688602 [Topomyia yanbarensis]
MISNKTVHDFAGSKNNVGSTNKSKRKKVRDPIKRVGWYGPSDVGDLVDEQESMDYPRRYEESDPHVFSYEQGESGERTDNRRQNSLPEDTKYFQYLNFFGDGSYNAGSKRGNDRHYIEQHEQGSNNAGVFQKRVKWADKHGGFGEHYWDLNHVTD